MAFIGRKPTNAPLTSSDLGTGIVGSTNIADGTIVNADVNSSAAIAYSKLSLANSIAIADFSATGTPSSTTFLRGDNTWGSAGATAGQVIQVVTATDSTGRSTASSAYGLNNSTLSVNITPSATANKMFVIITTSMSATNGYWTIFRDSTDLNLAYYGNGDVENPGALSILDSPNTTSQVNYQIRFKANSGTTNINTGPAKGVITVFEIKG